VVLPAGSSKDEREKAPDLPEPKGARILVMDDKSMVRNTLLSILGRLGYSGDTAVDGRDTLSKYQDSMKEGKPFDAVILDLTIPNGMGGEETIEELLNLDPDVKAIVSSGYSNSPVLGDYRAYGFQGMIMKPYSIEGLSDVLQKVLSD